MAASFLDQFKTFHFFFRKKRIDTNDLGETKLARVLNTLDLTALGNSIKPVLFKSCLN